MCTQPMDVPVIADILILITKIGKILVQVNASENYIILCKLLKEQYLLMLNPYTFGATPFQHLRLTNYANTCGSLCMEEC